MNVLVSSWLRRPDRLKSGPAEEPPIAGGVNDAAATFLAPAGAPLEPP